MTPVRCCNLDWLEVYCLEPVDAPRDIDYFVSRGYEVRDRGYGTRVYNQMFVILDEYGHPDIEVRRDPMQRDGILPINACHLRLTNRSCYYDCAAQRLADFLNLHGYLFSRIARLDVCLDFERFDSGDYPAKFVPRYLKRVYSKINQGRIRLVGEDHWDALDMNSLAWGSPKSHIGTKLYNKSLQLRQVLDKPYIRQAWFEAGLVDHPVDCYKIGRDGRKYTPDIWRLEFSIKSGVKGWYTIEENGNARKLHSYRHDLTQWASRDLAFEKFASLVPHYFHFKKFVAGQRKDRCPDKVLFHFDEVSTTYHVDRVASAAKTDPSVVRLRRLLEAYREKHADRSLRQAIDVLLRALIDECFIEDMQPHFTREDVIALQRAIALRSRGSQTDPAVLMHDIRDALDDYSGDLFC